MLTEIELRQMNEDIGELLAALGTAYGYLTDGHAASVNRCRPLQEVHQKIGQSHRDRQHLFRTKATEEKPSGDFMPMQSSADYSGDYWGT